MTPSAIYKTEGASWINSLAQRSGINRKYLYQCVTGRRKPSPEYAKRMIEADSRLTFDAIYSDDLLATATDATSDSEKKAA